MNFTIKDEFKNLLPEHSEKDFKELEEDILKEGVKKPLLIWKEQNILIDGHTRLSICQKHKLPYEKGYKSFASEDHVIAWIIQNQFDNELHRKLTAQERKYLIGKKYAVEKKISAGAPKGNQNALKEEKKQCPQKEDIENNTEETPKDSRTVARVAEEEGVCKATVERNEKFAKAVDTLAEIVSSDIKTEILSGQVKIPRDELNNIALVAQSEPKLAKEQYEDFKMGRRKKKNKKKATKATSGKVTQKSLMANVLHKNMMPDAMDKAYRDFEFEIQKAHDVKWETVSKEAVSHFINKLIAIVES